MTVPANSPQAAGPIQAADNPAYPVLPTRVDKKIVVMGGPPPTSMSNISTGSNSMPDAVINSTDTVVVNWDGTYFTLNATELGDNTYGQVVVEYQPNNAPPYPVVSGPTSSSPNCKVNIPGTYQTDGYQAIRIVSFGDNCNLEADANLANVYAGNVLVYWSQIETSENIYNWSPIDTPAQAWINAGKHWILRVSTCGQAGWTSSCSNYMQNVSAQGTPQWVLNAMHTAGDNPASYTVNGAVVPKYWSTTFISKFNNFLKALGQRYNGSDSLEYVQMAVGMGGECKPDTTGSSTTPLSTNNPTKWNNLKSIGFNNTVWLNFIKQTHDQYALWFPNTRKCAITASFFDNSSADGWGSFPQYHETDIVNYAISKGCGLQADNISITSGSYNTPNPLWQTAPFISMEQRLATNQSGDNLECDIQAMLWYAGPSRPIYCLIFSSDLNLSGSASIIAKYADMS